MDVGPAKQRPRSTADVTKIDNVSLYMSATQLAVFDAFYRETLGFGSAAFEWVHPRTGNPVDARFTEAPKYTSTAPRQDGNEKYRVDMVLELMPGTEVVAPPPPPPPPDLPPEPLMFLVEAGTGAPAIDGLTWLGPIDEPDPPAPVAGDNDWLFLVGPRPMGEADPAGLSIGESESSSVVIFDTPPSSQMGIGGGFGSA